MCLQAVPWSYRVPDPDDAAPRDQDGAAWQGYCLDFLRRLATDLRFDYELVASGEFGARGKDGVWTGLVGDLARGVSIPESTKHQAGVKLHNKHRIG